MKVLLISEFFGKTKSGVTAPGLVAEKIAKGLSKYAEVDIITSASCYKTYINGNIKVKTKFSSYTLENISYKIFGCNLFSKIWSWELSFRQYSNYDLVFSVVSMYHYGALELGDLISRKNGFVHFSYFVDAIPAPKEYMNIPSMSSVIINILRKRTDYISAIFSTCKEMSDYQKKIINNNTIFFDELYNPSDNASLLHLGTSSSNPVFVYAGSIYKPRNPRYILKAFEQLVSEYPCAEIIFVGSDLGTAIDDLSQPVKHQIHILPFQIDIIPLYEKAIALIDINSDVLCDIYMSSKITSYISYNRPIICESTVGSAPRRVFKNLKTVLNCNHDSSELYEAMKFCIKNASGLDYSERDELIKDMSIDGVAVKILSVYKQISELNGRKN